MLGIPDGHSVFDVLVCSEIQDLKVFDRVCALLARYSVLFIPDPCLKAFRWRGKKSLVFW